MTEKILAYTKLDAIYPGFVNVTQQSDGVIVLMVRADPKRRQGCYVCGFAKDKGSPGRCTPGDDCCNNYCNMAPQKGPMQSHPLPCEQVLCGAVSTINLSADEWSALKLQLTNI